MKIKHVFILVLPRLFDNMDSKAEYRFPLSLKRQSNFHFWLLFDEKIWISVLNGRCPTKTVRNFQPNISSLLRRQYIYLFRCFGVSVWSIVVCILTRPANSSKYSTTRKNIPRYCTPKHLIRDLLSNLTFFNNFSNFKGNKCNRMSVRGVLYNNQMSISCDIRTRFARFLYCN